VCILKDNTEDTGELLQELEVKKREIDEGIVCDISAQHVCLKEIVTYVRRHYSRKYWTFYQFGK